jgi:hypothetical protein
MSVVPRDVWPEAELVRVVPGAPQWLNDILGELGLPRRFGYPEFPRFVADSELDTRLRTVGEYADSLGKPLVYHDLADFFHLGGPSELASLCVHPDGAGVLSCLIGPLLEDDDEPGYVNVGLRELILSWAAAQRYIAGRPGRARLAELKKELKRIDSSWTTHREGSSWEFFLYEEDLEFEIDEESASSPLELPGANGVRAEGG